ncbi:LysR family transcriptional regulator [Pseudomonas saxonica]|uniref:LysR family transcriptional regulator n=1 Tax=Pseudomonas saxonica TaxID=2600598 RepID=A0ABY3GDB8_9PSED|nr:LysR family transcriptional regulator [Pseudomonas saxonica]TWR87103.1 LysR family transcriptional regulator [Pseudomonas saxonica]WRQ76321.1 LysR family transcriptional regulator [Pseudomonas saxonica]
MNLKQMQYALAVAEAGSFTLAAERCHTVQSALSHQVARLEQQLGAKLFERTSRRVTLTPAGEAFVRSAQLAVEAACRVPHEVAAACGEVRGNLSIGTISSLTALHLVDFLGQFHQRYQHVDIRLCVAQSERLLDDVRQRRLDIAFVGFWPGERLEGVQWRLLAEEELAVVVPAGHTLASRTLVSLAQLVDQPLVDFPAGSSARRQTDEAFSAKGLNHRVQFEVDSMDLMERFVRGGLAIGLVPTRVAQGFHELVTIAVSDAPMRRVYAIWSTSPTPAAQAFIESALPAFNAREVSPLTV